MGYKVRKVSEPKSLAWRIVIVIVKSFLVLFTRPHWINGTRIPAQGGCILVVNHVSHIDPLTLAWIVYEHGRLPRYLAKASLWDVPIVGAVTRSTGQIPVSRQSRDAAASYEAACEAVREGKLICVYVEGSITKDPEGWPMRGKTGAARIALTTGCPVIPVGQWGAQDILPAYSWKFRFFPRRTARYKVGKPLDLTDLADQPMTHEVLHEATDRIMDEITNLVADLRGLEPPVERFDPRAAGVAQTGNPVKKGKAKKRRLLPWRK